MDELKKPNDEETGGSKDSALRKNNSQSSSIWIIGIAMLVVGLVFGYIGRGAFGPEVQAARATNTAVAAAYESTAAADLSAAETRAVANTEVMQLIVSKTTHYKGQVDAPVTLIEFSDFK